MFLRAFNWVMLVVVAVVASVAGPGGIIRLFPTVTQPIPRVLSGMDGFTFFAPMMIATRHERLP